MPRRNIRTRIKRGREMRRMKRTSKKNRKKRAKAKAKTDTLLQKLEAARLLRVKGRKK